MNSCEIEYNKFDNDTWISSISSLKDYLSSMVIKRLANKVEDGIVVWDKIIDKYIKIDMKRFRGIYEKV